MRVYSLRSLDRLLFASLPAKKREDRYAKFFIQDSIRLRRTKIQNSVFLITHYVREIASLSSTFNIQYSIFNIHFYLSKITLISSIFLITHYVSEIASLSSIFNIHYSPSLFPFSYQFNETVKIFTYICGF